MSKNKDAVTGQQNELQPIHIEAATREELDERIAKAVMSAPDGCTVTAQPLYDPWKPCFYCDITFTKP